MTIMFYFLGRQNDCVTNIGWWYESILVIRNILQKKGNYSVHISQ